MSCFKHPGLFITATDTGVGKTVVTGLLGSYLLEQDLPIKIFKPVQCGVPPRRSVGPGSDPAFYKKFLRPPEAGSVETPLYTYPLPQAPSIAARAAKQPPPRLEKIIRHCRRLQARGYFPLVEGVGGLLVPLDGKHTVLDLAQGLAYPVLVVSRPFLGTINHTLLTLEILQRSRMAVLGVVFNRVPLEKKQYFSEVFREIEHFSGVPALGWLPEFAKKTKDLPGIKNQPAVKAVFQSIIKLILKKSPHV